MCKLNKHDKVTLMIDQASLYKSLFLPASLALPIVSDLSTRGGEWLGEGDVLPPLRHKHCVKVVILFPKE